MTAAEGVEPTVADQRALDESIHALRLRSPDLSASRVVTVSQALFLAILVVGGGLGFAVDPLAAGTALAAAVTLLYFAMLVRNGMVFRRMLHNPSLVEVGDGEARAALDATLPVYTVLIPAFHEPEVISSTLAWLGRMDYPAERLDVKLLLEADDVETRRVVATTALPRYVEVVLVPPAAPRTKPKALNIGLRTARGDYLTIYDAEDRPEPLQLRRAVAAFARSDDHVSCLQAKLGYHNAGQNLLTSWFALEYVTWFGFILPVIAAGRTPVPLGGTSTHFRTEVLRQVGAWDPHNVTEDCDLGIRLYRLGYRTRLLDSITYEEANSDVINWVRQRSRWVKGYAQTWLVHMRRPIRLWRQLGTRGFAGFNLLVGGSVATSVLNLAMWAVMVVWFLFHPAGLQEAFPGWVYYPAMICMVAGNFLGYYSGILTAHIAERPDLLRAALLVPVYWVLISMAACRAVLQLLISPFTWDKTVHGLDQSVPEAL